MFAFLYLSLRIDKLAEIIAELRQPSLPAPGKGTGEQASSDTVPSLSRSQEDSDLLSPTSPSQSEEADTLLR